MPAPARIDATVARIIAAGRGPHSVGALIETGITRAQLRAAVAADELIVLRRGIVIPCILWRTGADDERREWAVRAALLAYPEGIASRDTAVVLHGLPDFGLPRTEPTPIPRTHITRTGAARRDDWLTVHGCDTPPEWVSTAAGIRATDLVRTSIEASATRSQRGAVVLIDAAMRRAIEESKPDDLRRAADPAVVRALRLQWRPAVGAYAGHRWVTRARFAVEFANPAAESVLESLSRYEMHRAELPPPQIGVQVRGDDGCYYWADAYWPEHRLIGEADGLGKYSDIGRLVAEKRRQEALEGAGYRLVRWGWSEVYPNAAVMVERVRRALSLTPPTRPEWS